MNNFQKFYRKTDYVSKTFGDTHSVVFFPELCTLYALPEQTARRLSRGPDSLSAEEREHWDRLADTAAKNPVGALLRSADPRDGYYLAINVNLTSRCNLNCVYCFADGGSYGRLNGDMSLATAEKIEAFAAKHLNKRSKVRFEHFGGEPLMNLACMEKVCKVGDVLEQKEHVDVVHRISTNLTTVSKDAMNLLTGRKFIVSVSIDGAKQTHNRNRPGKNGRLWYDDILKNIRRLKKHCPDMQIVARMTVHDNTTTLKNDFTQLWEEKLFDYFQILPSISSQPAEGIAPNATEAFASLTGAYADYFSKDNPFKGILEIEYYTDMIVKGKIAPAYCSAGRNYITLSKDGSMAPCHRLAGDKPHSAHTIESQDILPYPDWKSCVLSIKECKKCWLRYLCGGGCRQSHLALTGKIDKPHKSLCRIEQIFAFCSMSMLSGNHKNYTAIDRSPLQDMFVSCGRPSLNARTVNALQPNNYFKPVTINQGVRP